MIITFCYLVCPLHFSFILECTFAHFAFTCLATKSAPALPCSLLLLCSWLIVMNPCHTTLNYFFFIQPHGLANIVLHASRLGPFVGPLWCHSLTHSLPYLFLHPFWIEPVIFGSLFRNRYHGLRHSLRPCRLYGYTCMHSLEARSSSAAAGIPSRRRAPSFILFLKASLTRWVRDLWESSFEPFGYSFLTPCCTAFSETITCCSSTVLSWLS